MVKIAIIESKFNRDKGVFKNTTLWKDLEEREKVEFSGVSLVDNEKIIIASVKPFYLLTNLRIINHNYSIYYSDIKTVTISEIDSKKAKIEKIELLKYNSQVVFLEIEDGTWTTMYNIIKLLLNQSKRE